MPQRVHDPRGPDLQDMRVHAPGGKHGMPAPGPEHQPLLAPPRGRHRAATTPAQLLAYQRLAGNQAVQRMVIQRKGACCDSCAGGGGCESETVEAEPAAPFQLAEENAEEATPAEATGGQSQETEQPPPPDAPEIDTSPLDSVIEAPAPQQGPAGQEGPETNDVAPTQTGGAASGSSCNVFASMSGWTHSDRGSGAAAAQTGFTLSSAGNTFRATLNQSTSWVNTYFVPQGNARTGRAAAAVTACQQHLGSAGSGATWTFSPSGCAAGGGGTYTASSAGECESIVGVGIDGDDRNDVPRLLRHEQYHLKLACALADKATAAVAAGTSMQTASQQLGTAATRETQAYDSATSHGCNATGQATWQSNIDAGNVTFP